MARAAVVLAFAVFCLLVVPAPAAARRPVDLPRQLPDAVDDARETAAEKLLLPMPVQVADAEAAADHSTAIAVPEADTAIAVQEEEEGSVAEERPQLRSSLLCLVFRCGGGAGRVAVARGSSQERQALDGWAEPAVAGTPEEEEEVHGDGERKGAYDSDSDWDSDCDSDDEDEGGILVGWFRSLTDRF